MAKIWIARAHDVPHVLNRTAGEDRPRRWIYFGKDYLKLLECERCLSELGRIPASRFVQEAAWKIRQPYVDWISDLGRPYGDSLQWWTSRLAEKNTMGSDLFLNFCQLDAAEDIAQSQDAPLLIVVEDWALGLAIRGNLRQKGLDCEIVGSKTLWKAKGWLREAQAFLLIWFKGLAHLLIQLHAARSTQRFRKALPSDSGKPRILIHTCADEACLGKDGAVRDRYFTKLPRWFREQGYDVVTVVWPSYFRRPLREVFRWFRSRTEAFLIPEDYFCLRDYPKAVLTVLSQFFVGGGAGSFHGRSVGPLLATERLRQASAASMVRFHLYAKMVERLKAQNFRIDGYVDMFENMGVEKPVARALHEHYPRTVVVGMQHVPFDPFLMLYTVGRRVVAESRSVFPDRIVCCGERFREILAENGFPREILRDGVALRYLYLQDLQAEPVGDEARDGTHDTVLVVLPIELEAAAEIVSKVRKALDGLPVKGAVRPHPMTDRKNLLAVLGILELPETLSWADGDMGPWLRRSCCVMSSATAAVFEAILAGVPVVVVGRDVGLERNPLSWWEKDEPMFAPRYGTAQIREALRSVLNLSPAQRRQKMDRARELVQACFQKWDDQLLSTLFPKVSA